MKISQKLFFICIMLNVFNGLAQTAGLIYKPAGNALGKSVLDTNGDGFSSPTLSGFSGTDYGSGSELQMVALPVIIDEPLGDLTTSSAGGPMDIVTNSSGSRQSCYLLVKNVGGIDYLIARFRMGSNSTAPKAYSILLDTDGSITNNYSSTNPGFEREIVLSASNAVSIYSHNGSGATLIQSYNVDNYQQRSVALSTVSGNADYFYDFFVPLAAINAPSAVRMCAMTVNSLSSGLSGTISDINGVNDTSFGGNTATIFQAVISASPPVTLTSLTAGYSFPNIITSTPVVTSVLTTISISISGTSQEANGTTITIYKNGISIGTTTVTSNAWTLTAVSGLVAGNLITAKATATGKNISAVSNTVEVSAVPTCYTPAPITLVRNSGQTITGNYAHVGGAIIVASTVRIRLFEQVNSTTFNEINAGATVYVATNGTWSFSTGLTQPVFNSTTIVATATYSGCISGYSVVNKKTSGQVGTTTATPTMVTTQIIASPSIARSVQVINNDATASYLILYINGYQVAISPTTIATGASYTFNYTGFIENDIVTARAQSATVDYWLSNPTAPVNVIASATPSSAPVITGTYTAGSGKTVTGTSIEISGTVITLYKAGTILLGTTTVNSFGNWSVTGLTLVTGDVLTAYAKASVKTLSAVSNSVTVAASVPTAPTVTAPITAGQTTINGTGGLGTITVYVDGSSIGTTTGASWTLSSINPLYVYRGGVVTATNTVSGIPSVFSNQVTIQGVVSFCITDASGNPITTKLSEDPFSIRITAMSGANCTGSVFTSFTGTVTISSSNPMVSGGGTTASFVNGVLTTTIAIGGSGIGVTINVVNTNDPTAIGTTSLNVTAITAVVSSNQTICSGTSPANLTLTTNLSTTVKWQKSSDTVFTSPVDIANTTSTLSGVSIGNLTSTTYFRAVLLTGSSSTVYSNYATITVIPASVGGTVTGGTATCSGTSSGLLTLSGHTGTIVRWEYSVSPFTSWTTIANTNTIYTSGALIQTTQFRAVVQSGACSESNAVPTTVIIDNTTWNGSSWSNGTPTGTKSAIFTGDATIGSDLNACSLTVNNNAVVSVTSGFDVTLNGSLTVSSGSFTLNNTSNLIQNGTNFINSGNIIVKRNSSALKRLDYTLWSSPVTGQGLYAFSPFTLPTRFYFYNTGTDLYSSVGFNLANLQYPSPLVSPNGVNGTDSNNVQFDSAKGYLIRMPWDHPTAATVWNGTFTGVPNNGDRTFAMTTGFNAVGNPYPSRINVHDFIDGNTNITGTIYLWRKTNDTTVSSYATITKTAYVANGVAGGDTGTGFFNAGSETNWVLNIGQGFLINATSSTNLSFKNSMRRSSNSDQFFRASQTVNTGLYWLNLNTNTGIYSQMAIGYSSEGTFAEDRGIDGKNINQEFYLTSLIGTDEYSIQGRPDFQSTDIVPLSYKVGTAGNYTISIDHTTGLFTGGSQSIYLKDNVTNTIHNLNTAAYTFTSEAGTFNNRFEIVYQTLLGNPTFTVNTIVIYSQNNGFVVNSGNFIMSSIKVFDSRGRLLEEKKGINASQTTINGGLANEVLLVQITSEEGGIVTKKVVR